MSKKFKDVLADIANDYSLCGSGCYELSSKQPHALVRFLNDVALDIEDNHGTVSDVRGYVGALFGGIASIGYLAASSIQYFLNCSKAKSKAIDAASGQLDEYVASVKSDLMEKYPDLANELSKSLNDAGWMELTSSIRRVCNAHCTTVHKNGFVYVTPDQGWEGLANDISNGFLRSISENINDIIQGSLSQPTFLDALCTPEIVVGAVAVAALPLAYYYGTPVVGRAALKLDLIGQHLSHYVKDKIIPTKSSSI